MTNAERATAGKPESTARELGDWLTNPEMLRCPDVVIPHLAVEGRVTLLSGREKIGKSTLCAGAAAAASSHGAVLGTEVSRPIGSLWYALDEPVADAVRRFQTLGADHRGIVINDQPRTTPELEAAIESDLERFDHISVVWVDTFSRVLAASDVDPNSSQDVEPVIARLVDLCHRANVAAVFLYHTNKGGEEYRGSTAIGAAVDDVLTLRRRARGEGDDFDDKVGDDGRRLLIQNGRNLRGRIQLTCSAGVYQLYDGSLPPREQILQILETHVQVTRDELVDLVPRRRQDTLRAITNLLSEGVITQAGPGLSLARETRELPQPELLIEAANIDAARTGSREFPQRGTAPELRPEPMTRPVSLFSSQLRKERVDRAGTEGAIVLPGQSIDAHGRLGTAPRPVDVTPAVR